MRLWNIKLDCVYHVGSLSAPEKRGLSLEGPGLSVSLHPDAWRYIAKLSGPTWELCKRNGRGVFLDMVRLPDVAKHMLLKESDLVVPATAYAMYYYDEDFDEERYFVFWDRAEADEEADDPSYEATRVEPISVYAPTQEFSRYWHARFDEVEKVPPDLVGEFALLAAVEEQYTHLDGAWWDEILDPVELSAPRGVIFLTRTHLWEAKPV